ncbi:hypothetical protein IHE51_01400 [Candidatus Parvarchaeota archaeon]|uniref:50S ribosomal protein L22 n=1 Tax=Candidatus Acidifodinimicrobium mancum TaxID=2898728 RepID=A0A8T3V0H9_9ARCH|nr:hypothetical protein [Candidatus Acidifodinimicrobium mancum]MBE5729086.1 hypothetical protein [Candidatus Acidifodinimicrobium mancum]MBE5729802.1 hypothetical protein [Candidatus Acidifodinimicrobium mancum]
MIKQVSAKSERVQVSLKHVHEIMESVTGKNLDKAIKHLDGVLEEKRFIPFNKYGGKGHKSGVPRGYPKRATKFVISLLKELKSNAKNINLDEASIIIKKYSLGRGKYPRFPSGAVYRHGKFTNLVVFGEAEAKAPKEEKKTSAPASAVEATNEKNEENNNDATKENDKRTDEGAGDKGLPVQALQ